MSLCLPKKKPIAFKKNDASSAWLKHNERMRRVNAHQGVFKPKIQYWKVDPTVLRTLVEKYKTVSFNSHSWHEAINNSITSFTVRKNGEKTIQFGTSDNRLVGYSCRINGSTSFEKIAEIILMTKFPSDENSTHDKFVIFLHCKHINFSKQIDKFLDNSIFHMKLNNFVKNGNFIFEF